MRPSVIHRIFVALCMIIVLGVVGAPTAGASTPAAAAATDSVEQSPTIVANYTFALTPDRPGQVVATLRFELPDTVDEFRATVPDAATVRSLEGFERGDGGMLQWDGRESAPTLRFDWNVSQRAVNSDAAESVDTGSWALLTRPDVDTRWQYTDAEPDYRVEMSVGGKGVGDGKIAYLGPHDVERAATHNQTIDVVLPKAVERFDPEALRMIERASTDLRVGARSPSVTVFVVPRSVSFPGYIGFEHRNAFWIRAGAPVRSASNLWVHEYIHARQAYQPTTAMEWLDEGAADYYAALVTYRAGAISFEEFYRFVAPSYYGDEALTNRSSWPAQKVEYRKGRLVVAALDAKLRQASDGNRTFQDIYRRLNDHEDKLNYASFRRTVVDVGNESLGTWLDDHVNGSSIPSVPKDQSLWSVGGAAADTTIPADRRVPKGKTTDDAATTRKDTDRTTILTGVEFVVPVAIVAVALLVLRAVGEQN